jgi:CheY-like chemotaxis protein
MRFSRSCRRINSRINSKTSPSRISSSQRQKIALFSLTLSSGDRPYPTGRRIGGVWKVRKKLLARECDPRLYLRNPDKRGLGPLVALPLKVLLVDDYEPFRRFVRSMLETSADLQIVGEASDGLEAVQKAEELHPDVILLDIGLPTLNGLEVARRIHRFAPEIRIIFISQESSAEIAQEALSTGAYGYIFKAHTASNLFSALDAVSQGRRFIGSGLLGETPKPRSTILCIDTDADALQLRRMNLERSGYDVVTSPSCGEGLGIFSSGVADAVVLRCSVGIDCALAVAAAMRSLHRKVPLILYSPDTNVPEAKISLFDRIIPKYTSPHLLISTLRECLSVKN